MSRGYFGIGMYAPTKECNLGTLWRSAHSFGASFIFTIGAKYKRRASDTTHASKHIPYFPLTNFSEFESFRPHNCQLVGVEITDNARNLATFIHPERAIYLLGPENSSLGKSILKKCNHVVKFNTKFCLNVASAGTIVMYDRSIK